MRLFSPRIVAVEITPDRVNMIEVDPGRRPTVHAWATVEGPFADPSATAPRIQAALKESGFTARRAYLAPPVTVEHRHVSFPSVPRRELRRLVEREARRDSTIPREEQTFDFAVVGETIERSGARKKEIILAIAPEPEVERYVRIIEEAGLIPWRVTSRPLALMAAIALQEGGGGPVVVAYLQGAYLQVMVAEEGVLHFSREITLAADVAAEGAESWEAVSTEIHRSLLYFFEQSPRWRVGRILLTGGGAENLRGLQEALSKDGRMRVEIFDPKDRVELRATTEAGARWRAVLPSFAVPLGLASGQPEAGINLLPRQVEERKWEAIRRATIGAIGTAAVLIGAVTLYSFFGEELSLRRALEAQVAKWRTLEQQLRDLEQAERERQMHRARLGLLEGRLMGEPLWSGVLREVSVHAASDLLLHSMKLETNAGGYRLVLSGQVVSRSPVDAHVAFNRFYEGLQRSPFLATVTLVQPLQVSRLTPQPAPAPAPAAEEGEPPARAPAPAPASGPVPDGKSRLEFTLALALTAVARR
jgi:Tfp pilus assembly PilM family ATPase